MTALLDAGVNVVRINASHATPEIRARLDRTELQGIMKDRAESCRDPGRPPGPAHPGRAPWQSRCGSRRASASSSRRRPRPAAGEIPTTYDDLAADVHVGARILLDDGLLTLGGHRRIEGRRVEAVVHYGGELKSHKGMNLPGLEVSAPALTEKDLEDVQQAVALGVDYIALSFVRRPEDMEELRALVPREHQADREDREGHRAPEPVRHPRRLRRDHGRPRRSRRGAAVRGSAADAEADHPGGEPARQAGDHRHPDARVDDPRAAAHPGRSLRRRQRHPRRHRRGDALGGDRGGALPARGGAGDGPDRAGDGAAAARGAASPSTRRSAAGPAKAWRCPTTSRGRPDRCAPRTPSPWRSAPPRRC